MIPLWETILRYIDHKPFNMASSERFQDCKLYEYLLKCLTKDEEWQVNECTLIENHDGMCFPAASIVHRYKIRGTHANEPFFNEMIVKLRKDDVDRSKYRIGLLYHNEIIAFTSILPILERFCEFCIPSPYVYYARQNIIIMELLGNQRYYPVHRSVKGLKHKYCEPVLKSLAKFHSASFVCKHKDPLILEGLKVKPKEVLFYQRNAILVNFMVDYFERLVQQFERETWSDEIASIIATLEYLRDNFVTELKELIYTTKQHDVFCHGDLRVSNILIKHDLEDARFIDFQQICYSSVARDLVTLFYVNLQPEELHNCTEDYLKSYWNHLHAYLEKQGIDLRNVLTEEWLAQEMKRYQLYGVVYGLWHLAEFYIDNITKKMSLNRFSKYKSFDFFYPPFEDSKEEFFHRAKSIVLHYINQVSSDDQIIVKDEVVINEEYEADTKPFCDEEAISADGDSEDNIKAEVGC